MRASFCQRGNARNPKAFAAMRWLDNFVTLATDS